MVSALRKSLSFKSSSNVLFLAKYIDMLINETYAGNYLVEITRQYEIRSLKQNNYYFGFIVAPLAKFFGYTSSDMHDKLKGRFSVSVDYKKNARGEDEEFISVESTKGKDTVKFNEYCEMIRIWALVDWDFYIPLPNEEALDDTTHTLYRPPKQVATVTAYDTNGGVMTKDVTVRNAGDRRVIDFGGRAEFLIYGLVRMPSVLKQDKFYLDANGRNHDGYPVYIETVELVRILKQLPDF